MHVHVDPASLSAAEERTVKELLRMTASGNFMTSRVGPLLERLANYRQLAV